MRPPIRSARANTRHTRRKVVPEPLGTEGVHFDSSEAQKQVLSEPDILVEMFRRYDHVLRSIRKAFPEATYWLGAALLSNHVANHAVNGKLNQPC